MSTDPDVGSRTALSNAGLAGDPGVVESLLNAPTIGLVVVGPDGVVECVDESAADFFGLASETGVGSNWTAFRESHVAPALGAPESEESRDLCVRPGGGRKERWLRHSTIPVTAGEYEGGRLEQFVDVSTEHAGERADHHRRIVETTDDAVFVVDDEWAIEYANPAAESLAGQSLSAITGRTVSSVFESRLAGQADELEATLGTVFGSGTNEPATVEVRFESSTGSETHRFECRSAADGEQAVISVSEVSEQRRRERHYETLVDNFPNGAVTLVDEDLRYQLAGGKLFEHLSETPEDVEGSDVGDLDSGDRSVFVESYRSALDGEPAAVETTVEGRELVLRALPVPDEDGVVRTAIGMTQDVTERKAREEELRWKSRALDEAPVGVTITDPEQVDNPLIYANKQFTDVSEYDTESILGRNCRFLQGAGTDPEKVDLIRTAIEEDRPVSVELKNYRADGTEFWNHLDIAPVHDETGAVINYVGFQQDVTERKEQQEALREVNQLLDVALTETGTGIWVLEDDDQLTPFGTTAELCGVDPTVRALETYLDAVHPDDRPVVSEALETARENGDRFDLEFRVVPDGTERWIHSRGTVSEDGDEQSSRIVGVVTDITEQKRRIDALQKRERVLDELHTATREFYPPESLTEIAEFLVGFTENAFETDYVSVKQYDEGSGALEPTVRSVPGGDEDQALGTVSPGPNPVWDAYRAGETRRYTGEDVDGVLDGIDVTGTQLLVVPVGDLGVLIAVSTAEQGFDTVDVDLVEVLTANAESAFQRLRSDRVHAAITAELSAQQSRVAELKNIIDSVQSVQQRLADSDSQEALETGVCDELLTMDRVDFVWLGQPTGEDTDLSAAAWAGEADGYLDAVLEGCSELSLPAQRAANDHRPCKIGNVASHVLDECWAKEALSHGFESVSSVPLVYDEVLYGVLSVYSETEDAFDGIYEDLLTDVASLTVNYSRILDQRQVGSQRMHTELEFELTDSAFPLHRLAAATESRIRFDTVAERTSEHVRLLVTVVDGDAEAVLDRAAGMTSIDAADWFGAVEHSQLSLLVRKPFLESVVSKHGGRLLESVSDGTVTTFRVELPANVSQRPIFDSLTSRYEGIDLVAKRQRHSQSVPDANQIDQLLTDRQCEVLNAAFHGGYYETPRRVKGEDLAESFGISGPAVYNHLQAAHRTLLERIFDSEPENND